MFTIYIVKIITQKPINYSSCAYQVNVGSMLKYMEKNENKGDRRGKYYLNRKDCKLVRLKTGKYCKLLHYSIIVFWVGGNNHIITVEHCKSQFLTKFAMKLLSGVGLIF